MSSPTLHHSDYKVAWIAILPIEVEAAVAVLDTRHEGHFETLPGDDYIYIGGAINGHNVVIAKPPAGQNYGPGTAAALALHLKARFGIWFALLVGVAAGLPDLSIATATMRAKCSQRKERHDIRLGDVLVCMPDKSSTGLVHYDLGTETDTGFVPNGRQAETPPLIRSAIGSIQVLKKHPFRAGNDMAVLLEQFYAVVGDEKFMYPGQDQDELFEAAYHVDASGVDGWSVVRQPRDESEVSRVWYGKIGSGGAVMRNARKRDYLRDTYDLIGLEMEAAGVMNILPTGVIRGVCDYGDAYKTKQWQPYAAAVAAVYAKAILLEIRPQAVSTVVRAPSPVKLPGQPNPTAYRYPLPRDRKSYFGQRLKERGGRFGGRKDILDQLAVAAGEDVVSENKKIISLFGFGGIGKTEILLEYALMACQSNHIFFCQATSGQSFEECVATLANAVGSEALDASVNPDIREKVWNSYGKQQRVEAFIRWLRTGPEGSSLILFDDIDAFKDENDHNSLSTALRSWPHTVLLTTRNPDLGDGLSAEASRDSDSHCIEALPEDDLIPVMSRYMNRRLQISREDLATIARLMEGHAMAACRAIQFISQALVLSSEDPVGHFIAGFHSNSDDHNLREEFIRFQPRPGRSLAMCFETSIERLRDGSQMAGRVLGYAAYLSCCDVDFRVVLRHRRTWLSAVPQNNLLTCREIVELSDARFRELLKQLVATSALIWTGSRLTVHRLMQEYLFHRHGNIERLQFLREIMLFASISIHLEEKETIFRAVVSGCGAIASKFGIRIDDIEPHGDVIRAIRQSGVVAV